MNTTSTSSFRYLRECQARSAREQKVLSGRDWLLVTVLVQLLTALNPIYLWVTDAFFHVDRVDAMAAKHADLVAAGMLGVTSVLFLLWLWAKMAPFRASLLALVFYASLQVYIAVVLPMHAFDSVASKVLVLLGLVMAVRTGYKRRHSA